MAGDDSLKTYRGNCHCGKFVYEITVPELKDYVSCTCSICSKKGYAWKLVNNDNVKIIKSAVDLTAYTFNDPNYKHMFCPDCGTPLYATNTGWTRENKTGFNMRALQDIDIWSLEANLFDEPRTRPPQYKTPVYTGPEPSAEVENAKIYHGSCHCGAVTVALKSKPLETLDILKKDEEICECNCSICVRGAYIWIYPETRNRTVVQGEEHLAYRIYNTTTARKAFCKHCGVHMLNESNPMTDEQVEALSDSVKEWRKRRLSFRNINLRILNDFDTTTLKTTRLDGWNELSPGSYENP